MALEDYGYTSMTQSEATELGKFYRDWEHLNPAQRYTLTELTKFIRQKGWGVDVREAIARGIEELIGLVSTGGDLESVKAYLETLQSKLNNIAFSDINLNYGKVTPAMLSDELIKMIAGTAGINATVADSSITSIKIAPKAIDTEKLSQDVKDSLNTTIYNYFDGTKWNASRNATVNKITNGVKLTGNGTSTFISSSTFSNEMPYVAGDRVFISCKAKVLKGKPTKLFVLVYNEKESGNPQFISAEPVSYTESGMYSIYGIATLPKTSVEGKVMYQVRAMYDSATLANGSIVEFTELIALNVTDYPYTNEEIIEHFKDVKYFSRYAPSSVVAQVANTKAIPENKLVEGNILPTAFNKFGEEVLQIAKFDGSVQPNRLENSLQDSTVRFEGKPTYALTADSALAYVTVPTGSLATTTQDYQYIDLYYYADDGENIGAAQIDLANGSDLANKLSYYYVGKTHSETNDTGFNYMRIPLDTFTQVRKMDRVSTVNYIRVVFNKKVGSTKPLKVNVARLDFIKAKKGAVSIYFDDAYKSQYEHGFRIMQKYNLTGTIGVITTWAGVKDNAATWQDLRDMHNAGWIVCSHTHTHIRLRDVDDATRDFELKTSHEILKRQGFLFGARCYIAPFGSYNADVDKIARKYYAIVRSSTNSDRDKPLNEFPQSHPRRQMYLSPYNTDTFETFKGWIDAAIAEKKELCLAFHQIDPTLPDIQWNVMPEVFEQVCAYIAQKRDEGVLEVVNWKDTLTNSSMQACMDNDGLKYMISNGTDNQVLELPVYK